MRHFLSTNDSVVALFQRVVLGFVIAGHGAQKLLGWFGGGGWDGTLAYFASKGIPGFLGALIVIAESFGALALIAGFATRLSAGAIAAILAGSIVFEHGQHGFFMNWFGQLQGEGSEFAVVVIALALPLVGGGGGRYSLDGFLARRLAAPSSPIPAALAARS